MLSPHFSELEAFPPRCDRENLAVPFTVALENARYLAVAVLEPWRGILRSPLGINSWARDLTHNATLATDPASRARVAQRAGPHCDGSAADVRIVRVEGFPAAERDLSYDSAFFGLWASGLPVRRAILEKSQPSDDAFGRGRGQRITHIHVQATEGKASRVFVVRDWKRNAAGVWCEDYRTWTPKAPTSEH
jgi:hypothetical protein